MVININKLSENKGGKLVMEGSKDLILEPSILEMDIDVEVHL